MKFDDIFRFVGGTGRYQILVAFILYLGAFLGADIILQVNSLC